MDRKQYLLLDRSDYLSYFLEELKDKYIPVVCDVYAESYLKVRGIRVIGIFDFLEDNEIEAISQQASCLVDNAIVWFDDNNKELYKQTFSEGDINFVYATMNYLFKRFVIGSFRLIKGLESIIKYENITDLSYLHNGNPVDLCGNRQHKAFCFPDDAVWRLIDCWEDEKKPHLSFLKVKIEDKSGAVEDIISIQRNFINLIKIPLRNTRTFINTFYESLLPYSHHKKNLLFITPLYDLSFILSSKELKRRYNIIIWDVDENINPRFLKKQPIGPFFLDEKQQKYFRQSGGEFLKHFNFENRILKNLSGINVKLDNFLFPLIRRYFELKLPDILSYWKAAESLHEATKIDTFFWANPPHRYPGGIINEFFRLKKVPIFGMQHGGVYGSNYMGRTIFDLDLNHCDYYFSYGFDNRTLGITYPKENRLPRVVPVGSIAISETSRKLKLIRKFRKRIKLLFPIAVTVDNIFTANENIMPRLSSFQQSIIGLLARFDKYKVVLKFPFGAYKKHCLRPYIEKLYPSRFCIIDTIPYKRCLELYSPEIILIEQQGTPLNESLITKSNLIVYNDNVFIGLTDEAKASLEKRAVVCNSKDEFLKKLEDSMNNNIEPRDLENREFLERYCIYNHSPEENIINAIKKFNDKIY